jgi:hypothetical protein
MRVFWAICVLLFVAGCSDGTDTQSSEPPLQHYKEAIDSAKTVKQLQEDANLQRMPKETN